MPINNPIQFGLVREDPALELCVLDWLQPKDARVLLVASGGCTALTLSALRPSLQITLIDANRAQLDLVERKVTALREHGPLSLERRRLFGIDTDDAHSLSGCGNFESLFRGWRSLINDLVMSTRDLTWVLEGAVSRDRLLNNRFWPASFEMFFGDALLEAMFGPEATQHAPNGSYPAYFRRLIEDGLRRPDAATNGYLHQVILGHYLDGALPEFMARPCDARFELVHAPMAAGPSFDRFDLIQLSNLFDWMDADGVKAIVDRLCAECRPGTVVLLRQLNNRAPVENLFAPAFAVDAPLSRDLTRLDRSLFYERVLVLVKQ